MPLPRTIERELLDELPPTDRGAVGSRRDLRLLNAVMGNHRLLARALRSAWPRHARPRLLDLATGDGTQMLRVARRLGPLPSGGELLLLDRHALVGGATLAALEALGWRVTTERADVFDWSRTATGPFDAVTTNLFLHHLPDEALAGLFQALASFTRTFVAVEPRRSDWQLWQSRLVGLLGCNHVTRQDAVSSVRAGFRGLELSQRWPHGPWDLVERPAGLASHVFVARRRSPA